ATALTTVTFESGSQLTTIGGYAFQSATALEDITIPASLETIGNFAFYNATALTTVTFESGSQLTTIEQGAFVGATLLTSITIPASVTSIGDYAFNGATTLTSFYFLGNAPTSVGMMPFWNVADGAKAIVRAGATGFGDEASWNGLAVIVEPLADGFYLCSTGVLTTTGTPTYRILDGEVSSGYSCAGAVVIPEGVTTIGSEAFAGESAITSITIPAGVTTIGSAAFAAASALTSITVDGANPNYSSTDGVLFNKDSSTLIAYPAGKTGTSYTIPAGVTTIGFLGFYGATSLTSFYFLGNAPDTDDSFYDFADGTKAYIKSGATGFGDTDSWGGLVVTIGVYTVTYNTSGGSVVTAQDYFANFPTPTSPTRTGYTFAGWSATAGGSVIAWPHTPASGSDITLYAKWTRDLAKAVATVKPSVSGTAKVSKVLAAKKGTWTGYPTPAITYQWYSCSKTVATVKAIVPNTCKKISGATKSTLKLAKAQKGKFIAVLVSGNSAGTSATTWLSKSTTKVS
ncbi:MAG: leucine-rich repeat protein, partial [Rhodoluna sp.]|nr:leucine-rich repeat protein [Rhodoluna sp.]